jgi:hypothetical protein
LSAGGRSAARAATRSAAGHLIAVDGIGERAMVKAARADIAALPRAVRGGVSLWDASGIFGDLAVAGDQATRTSARTLLLLYAADLAFRLRWEIRPALEEKRCVAAAPYVATALAFGRAAGLEEEWLTNLFLFAPAPETERTLTVRADSNDKAGFVNFACGLLASKPGAPGRRDLRARVRAQLTRASRRRA